MAPWFRYCLLITAVFNLFGAISFAPPVYYAVADTLGFPNNASPFGLWVLASWILIFAVGYAWLFVQPRSEPLFIAVAAACKIAIALFFFVYWFTGDFPWISLLVGSGDFFLGVLFIIWLYQNRPVEY